MPKVGLKCRDALGKDEVPDEHFINITSLFLVTCSTEIRKYAKRCKTLKSKREIAVVSCIIVSFL